MNEPRRHHFIPRFYLERFAEGGKLLVVHLSEGRSFETGPTAAAAQMDFYTLEAPDGSPVYLVEKGLGEIEGAGAAVIRKIDEGRLPLSDQSRYEFARLIALQIVRGRDFRAHVDATMDAIGKTLLANTSEEKVRNILKEDGEEPSEERVRVLLERIRSGQGFTVRIHQNHAMTLMMEGVQLLAPMVASMNWTVLKAASGSFITCDQPITMWSQETYPGVGAITADEVVFALDPGKALLMTWNGEDVKFPVEADHARVNELNQRALDWAFEWVFMHPESGHIPGLEDRLHIGRRDPGGVEFVRLKEGKPELFTAPLEEIATLIRSGESVYIRVSRSPIQRRS